MAEPKKSKKWVPLESNPEVLNTFAQGLGVKQPFSFTDVLGLDQVNGCGVMLDLVTAIYMI